MPLHPAVVHFPVALLMISLVFYILDFVGLQKKPWGFAAWCTLLAGTIMLLPALLSGSQAEDSIPVGSSAAEIAGNHEIAGYVVSWMALMLSGWASWRRKRWSRVEAGGFLIALFLLVAILTFTAMLGGQLVYEHGIGVTPIPQPPS